MLKAAVLKPFQFETVTVLESFHLAQVILNNRLKTTYVDL